MTEIYQRNRRFSKNATVLGFAGALVGNTKNTNPYSDNQMNLKLDWVHGWMCYHQGLLPWKLECKYREEKGEEEGIRIAEDFTKTGEIPGIEKKKLEELVLKNAVFK